MSWKLIFGLSLFGLAMAFATVYVVPSTIEPWIWLGIFIVCAYVIAKRAPKRYFLHGLCVSLVNCIWITGAHYLLYDAYAAKHVEEIAMSARMGHLGSPRMMMLATGPIIGLVSGIVLGALSWVMSKFVVSSHSDYAGW
jgi:uncharacterized membrane protein